MTIFCSNCGAKIDSDANYCSSCGAKLSSNQDPSPSPSPSSSHPPSVEPSIPLVQKRRMPLWFKILIGLALLALVGVTAGILFTESLVDIVEHQLKALRQEDIKKAYYTYTSKDFQEATSLEQFQNFVKAYPILLTSQSAHFSQRSIKNKVGTLKGNLTSNDHKKIPIEYKLTKEDGKWKILSIRLLQPTMLPPSNEAFNANALIDIVKTQLQDLEKGAITAAYENYSSQEFKESTSQEAFNQFVKKYPILTHHTQASFHKPSLKNGVSTIAAILKSNQTAAYLKYYLIYEDGAWKIWSMRILSPSEEGEEQEESEAGTASNSAPASMEFSHIYLGEQIDKDGMILNPMNHFPAGTENIYVNVEIRHGVPGQIVYLNFQHLDSGSFIPAKAMIEEKGDSILVSVFSPPAGGWPKGSYKLVTTSSTGLHQIINFSIE